MDYAEVIKKYHELKDLLDDCWNYICFSTKNGRRIIIKGENSNMCVPLDNKYRVVSFKYDEPKTLYDNPLSLLNSYFTDGGVAITDILITKDRAEATKYLNENKQKE